WRGSRPSRSAPSHRTRANAARDIFRPKRRLSRDPRRARSEQRARRQPERTGSEEDDPAQQLVAFARVDDTIDEREEPSLLFDVVIRENRRNAPPRAEELLDRLASVRRGAVALHRTKEIDEIMLDREVLAPHEHRLGAMAPAGSHL